MGCMMIMTEERKGRTAAPRCCLLLCCCWRKPRIRVLVDTSVVGTQLSAAAPVKYSGLPSVGLAGDGKVGSAHRFRMPIGVWANAE